MSNLKLSIIIPCYNCQETLVEAVESCFVQGLDNFEVVMVDDGSTDNTVEVMKRLAGKYSEIKLFFHEKNRGGGATRNTAVEHSQAEVIFCLDSDDLLPENTLSKMLDYLKEKNADGVGIHKSIKFINKDIKNIDHIDILSYVGEKIPLEGLLHKDGILCSLYTTFMFTKKAFKIAGGYPVEHGFDTQGFAWRFLSHDLVAYTCPESTYLHRINFHESYYLREANAGKINYNWRDIFFEHMALFDKDTQEFIKSFNCKDISKNFFEEVKKREKVFADNKKEIVGINFLKGEISRATRVYIKRNSLMGFIMRIKVRVKNFIKKNNRFYKVVVYFYALLQRVRNLLTENKNKTEYYKQINRIKKDKKIVLDIKFGGLGDWLVFTTLPRLLKETYGIDFYLSNKSLDIARNKDIYKLCFEMNPYYKGLSEDHEVFSLHTFSSEKNLWNFITDRNGENIVECLERQFQCEGKGVPEIYYEPSLLEQYKDIILVDKNYISGKRLGWDYDENSFEREIQKELSKSSKSCVEYVDVSKQTIFQYVDMLYSCDHFITVLSGGAALATCFKKPFTALMPYNVFGGSVDQFCFKKGFGVYVK